MAKIPQELIDEERRLLAKHLAAQVPLAPPKRELKGIRKVSQTVERTWVSAGCFGEAIQWKLRGSAAPGRGSGVTPGPKATESRRDPGGGAEPASDGSK